MTRWTEDAADDHWSEHGDRTPAQVSMDDEDGYPEPELRPGGCLAHPDAGHFIGFGLAGGGYGTYKVCAADDCSAVFDKNLWKDDEC